MLPLLESPGARPKKKRNRYCQIYLIFTGMYLKYKMTGLTKSDLFLLEPQLFAGLQLLVKMNVTKLPLPVVFVSWLQNHMNCWVTSAKCNLWPFILLQNLRQILDNGSGALVTGALTGVFYLSKINTIWDVSCILFSYASSSSCVVISIEWNTWKKTIIHPSVYLLCCSLEIRFCILNLGACVWMALCRGLVVLMRAEMQKYLAYLIAIGLIQSDW